MLLLVEIVNMDIGIYIEIASYSRLYELYWGLTHVCNFFEVSKERLQIKLLVGKKYIYDILSDLAQGIIVLIELIKLVSKMQFSDQYRLVSCLLWPYDFAIGARLGSNGAC